MKENNLKNILTIAFAAFAVSAVVYAAAPTGGYLPGVTTDPDCAPGDTDCTVVIPVGGVSDEPWFGTDDGAGATTNTEDIYTMGNVGVGTTAPNTDLHVVSGNNSIFKLERNAGLLYEANYYLGSGIGNGMHGLTLATDQGHGIVIDNNGTSTLPFRISSKSSGTIEHLLEVEHNGNVGIGTTAPSTKLSVIDTNTTSYGISTENSITQTGVNIFGSTGTGTYGHITGYSYLAGAYNDIAIEAGPLASGAYIYQQSAANGGNVGIGTTTPSTGGVQDLKLDVEGAIGADFYCDKDGNNCTAATALGGGGGASKFVDGTDVLDAVYTTGNVGIGTTSPGRKLHVAGSGLLGLRVSGDLGEGASSSIEILGTQSPHAVLGSDAARVISPTNRSLAFELKGNNDEDRFSFVTDPSNGSVPDTESMVILNSGNVGIGTTAPEAKLEIDTTAGSGGFTINKATGNGGKTQILLNENRNGANAHQKAIQLSNGLASNVEIGAMYDAAGLSYFYIDTDISDVGTGAQVGSAFAIGNTGNVGIGTTSPDSKLSVVGLPSGTDDTVTGGALAGAVCITNAGNMYIDTDGVCAN